MNELDRSCLLIDILEHLDGNGIVITQGTEDLTKALDYFDLALDTTVCWIGTDTETEEDL
jgi:hypothetical protein